MRRIGALSAAAVAAARVSGYLLWEGVTRAPVTRADEVPASAASVTAAWMNDVLAPVRGDARVEAIRPTAVSSGSSVRTRFEIAWDERGRRAAERDRGRRGGLPESVFAKMTSSLTTRLAHGLSGTMAAEACFFREIRPELDIEAPWGYHAACDLRTFRSVQLMEDLVATRGATFCTPENVVTRSQAEDVVATLAAIHAAFWKDPRLASRFHALKTLPQWYALPIEVFELDRYHEKAMDRAAAVVPPALACRRDEIWPAFRRAVAAHDEGPRTLIHSDVHLGNWYVTDAGKMGLGDWGCVAVGLPWRDLAYALSSALPVEDRRAWERDLVALHLDRLEAGGAPPIPFDDAWRAYREQMLVALLMWTPTLCPSPLLPDMQPESIAMEMIARITAAVDDLDSLDAGGQR